MKLTKSQLKQIVREELDMMQQVSEAVGEVAENVGLQQSIKDVVIATIKASTGGSDVDEGIVDTSIKQMLTSLGMIGA